MVLVSAAGADEHGLVSLGTLREVLAILAAHNTAPDGSGAEGLGFTLGMATLYGPGFVMEVPVTEGAGAAARGGGRDEGGRVSQALIYLTDMDFAWPVLSRLVKAQPWKLMDPETGRSFGGGSSNGSGE